MESCQLVEFTGGGTWFSMSGEWTGAAINWGLWKYDQDKWQEQKILQGIKVTSLLESSDGKLWVGTLKDGLWRYDGQYWHSFTTIDGLPSMRISELIQGRDGSLWIGTGTGVVRYQFNNDPPTIQIETVDGKTVDDFDDQDDDSLYITGKPNAFVHWQAFDKETPVGRLTYQYRMNQGDWSQPTTATSVTTPPQESGKHTFTVRAIDRDANLSQTDSITFQIDLGRPEVQISSPKDQTIVSGKEEQIVIRGAVNDHDLKLFRVEFSPLAPSLTFQLINQAEVEVERDRPLGLWKAQELPEIRYLIRLLAQDELGHQKSDQIQVTLDNTLP
ncbi:MAG: two-component regulator propeller domain-containing protein, partial [Candidatus Poribacteria bacterium]|nr:two-component regulator propeller domain-containing protein [Candidatus Poribacteria bacterium]